MPKIAGVHRIGTDSLERSRMVLARVEFHANEMYFNIIVDPTVVGTDLSGPVPRKSRVAFVSEDGYGRH